MLLMHAYISAYSVLYQTKIWPLKWY